MKSSKLYSLVMLLLAAVLVVTACGSNNGGSSSSNTPKVEVENLPAALVEKGDIKIKVIRKIGGDDHTAQFLAGAKKEGESLGFSVDTFSANGDTLKFYDALEQAANSDTDAVIVSHGDDATAVELVQTIRDKGIEVVTFDSLDEVSQIDGVPTTIQDDRSLATLALNQLIEDTGGEANIFYHSVDGLPPMVRRNEIYQEVLAANPGIVELDLF